MADSLHEDESQFDPMVSHALLDLAIGADGTYQEAHSVGDSSDSAYTDDD